MRKGLVSVVMPVFNCERFVAEAIESILNQTFTDFEFLIIDDGSTDRTLKILKNFSDPRLRVIRHSKNLGIVAALNRGIAEAKGEFIARQDGDDRSVLGRLAIQVGYLTLHPSVGVLGTSANIIDEVGRCIRRLCPPETDKGTKLQLLTSAAFIHGSVMIRANLLGQAGGYRDDFPSAEDYSLWLRLAKLTEFANTPELLYERRRHPESVSRKKSDEQRISVKSLRHLAWPSLAKNFYDFGLRDVFTLWSQFRPWLGCGGNKLLTTQKLFFNLSHAFFTESKCKEMLRASLFTFVLNPISPKGWLCFFLLAYIAFNLRLVKFEKYLEKQVINFS